MKVLVIEDDLIWQSRLQMMLIQFKNDVNIKLVASLSEGKELMINWHPDLIVSDVVLPDGLSYDIFSATNRTCPIIFLTGHPNNDYLKSILNLPKTMFIVKPFHQLSLQAMIEHLLPSTVAQEGLMIPGKFRKKILLPYEKTVYIKADRNYVHFQTIERRYSIKRSLRTVLNELDTRFLQVHKAFVINGDFATRLDLSAQEVIVNGSPIPVGRSFRENLIKLFS